MAHIAHSAHFRGLDRQTDKQTRCSVEHSPRARSLDLAFTPYGGGTDWEALASASGLLIAVMYVRRSTVSAESRCKVQRLIGK